jgi:hypothetical protein
VALRSSDATPAITRTYEIQKFSSGRWMLDSVADDKKVAIEMAAALTKSGRAPGGVQVMAVQRSSDGQFSEVRVHRSMPNDPQAAEKPVAAPKAEAKIEPKKATEIGDFKRLDRPEVPQEPKKKGRFKDLLLALKIAFGLGLCAALIEAFHILVR